MFRSSVNGARRTAFTGVMALAIFAGTSVVGVVAAPGVSSAATTPTLSLSGATSVKTSNGMGWTLGVGWDEETATTSAVTVGLERTDKTGGTGHEEHAWSFLVTTATLAFDAKAKTATLDTGTQTKPVATVDLAFSATSATKATCTTGSETIYKGTLSGDLSLVTGLTGGGTVGGKTLHFTVGTPELTVDADCVPPVPVNKCLVASAFSSGNPSASPSAEGISETVSGKAEDFVAVGKVTLLTNPANAERADVAEERTAPATYDATTKVYSVTTSASGLVTGSAKLSGGTLTTTTSTCSSAGKSHTETQTSATDANYKSPPGMTINARTLLSGVLSVPASTKTGNYAVVTVKAAAQGGIPAPTASLPGLPSLPFPVPMLSQGSPAG